MMPPAGTAGVVHAAAHTAPVVHHVAARRVGQAHQVGTAGVIEGHGKRRALQVLDLFSGLGGWSAAFQERGHDVRTLDIEPRFQATYCMDVRDFLARWREILGDWRPDVVLLSPDCTTWSTVNNGHWRRTGPRRAPVREPLSEAARAAYSLLRDLLAFLDDIQPTAWFLENPRGMMRKMPEMMQLRRTTVTYCRYGLGYPKPTDIWFQVPGDLRLRPPCTRHDPCDAVQLHGRHLESINTTSGSARRALISYELSLAVCQAMEVTT